MMNGESSTKRFIRRKDLKEEAERALEEVHGELMRRAEEIIENGIRGVDSLDDGIRLKESGWDGTSRGKELGGGVYVYAAEILVLDGRILTFSGDVALVR